MRKFFLFYFILAMNLSAQSWNEYYNQIKVYESISTPQQYYTLFTKDSRWSQKYPIAIENLTEGLIKILDKKGFQLENKIENHDDIPIINLELEVEYLNFYESKSGNLFGKGMITIILKENIPPFKEDKFRVTSDLLFKDGDLDDFDEAEYYEYFSTKASQVINQLLERTEPKLIGILNKLNKKYYSVIIFGKALINENLELSKKAAILDALRNGCEKTIGITLENIVTMIDYGDVSDILSTKLSGLVLNYKSLGEYDKVTSDGYYCVLVKAIITQNK